MDSWHVIPAPAQRLHKGPESLPHISTRGEGEGIWLVVATPTTVQGHDQWMLDHVEVVLSAHPSQPRPQTGPNRAPICPCLYLCLSSPFRKIDSLYSTQNTEIQYMHKNTAGAHPQTFLLDRRTPPPASSPQLCLLYSVLWHGCSVSTRKQNYMMNFARQTGVRHYYSRKRRALRQRA
ncbi:reelin [Lates japonicus]|uniref:Reelin n=1 Tax=Lates japonicus TaxID=270547 RepID=A0AAD3NE02_LATJO|nr:reelin [Lates japonicus]